MSISEAELLRMASYAEIPLVTGATFTRRWDRNRQAYIWTVFVLYGPDQKHVIKPCGDIALVGCETNFMCEYTSYQAAQQAHDRWLERGQPGLGGVSNGTANVE